MKNIIIAILVAIILILGFLFFTQKKSSISYEPWPETTPATVKPTTTNNTTNNYPVQSNMTSTQTNPTTNTNSTTSNYSRYSGEAPFTFTYPSSLFTPDYYSNSSEAYGSTGLSIVSNTPATDGCDMISIVTKEANTLPVCSSEENRYGVVINYCKITVGQKTGTTYKVNASTPQVCGKAASPTARSFVDHLVSELSKQ